jgi:hypothetical protein
MPRYAVLHDVASDDAGPVGFALEMDGYVHVHVPREYGIAERHDGDYRVQQPNLTYVTYRPGDPGYLDQLLIDLSWSFGVGEHGVVPEANFDTALDLLVRKVDEPRNRQRVGEYDFRSLLDRHRPPVGFVCGVPATYRAEQDELAIAARGRIVAA